jgi:hypothetical protein
MTIGVVSPSGIIEVDEKAEGAAIALAGAAGIPVEEAAEYLEDTSFHDALLGAKSAEEYLTLLESPLLRDANEVARRNAETALVFACCTLRKLQKEGAL